MEGNEGNTARDGRVVNGPDYGADLPHARESRVTRIGIVSPGFPESPGGVTDHTARLRRHWNDAGHEVEVLGTRDEAPQAVAARWRDERVAAVLIQYVPFLYGRRGVSRFPERLARAARERGMRTALFVHETWVPPTRLPWLVLRPIQKRQLLRLLGVVDTVVTAVPAWAASLGHGARVVRVGSNLGEPLSHLPTRPPLQAPVVFSPFAAGLEWRWIVAAAEAIGATPRLIVIGADQEEVRAHRVVGKWWRAEWDCRGRLPAEDVLPLLSRAPVVLAPFGDGLTGRRTSAMAAMSAGAQLLSSVGPLSDPLFDDGPVALARNEREFVERAQLLWADPESHSHRDQRLQWHRTHLEPKMLDARLLDIVAS